MLKYIITNTLAFLDWNKKLFDAPSPIFVKRAVIKRNGLIGASWIETGTYLGQTTEFLSSIAKSVVSIEPDHDLYKAADKYFSENANVTIVNGTSEAMLPTVLEDVYGDVAFWLDGHYSAGITFQGAQDTPIVEELAAIEKKLPSFSNVCLLIDDVRCFDPRRPEFKDYPTIGLLISWCDDNNFAWHIEHDIFVAKNY